MITLLAMLIYHKLIFKLDFPKIWRFSEMHKSSDPFLQGLLNKKESNEDEDSGEKKKEKTESASFFGVDLSASFFGVF